MQLFQRAKQKHELFYLRINNRNVVKLDDEPRLWIDGDAHRPVETGRDDVVVDQVVARVGDDDPVVERVCPVDAAGRPVHRQSVHLRPRVVPT